MNLFEIGWMISKTNDIYVTIVNGPFALFLVEVRSYDDPMSENHGGMISPTCETRAAPTKKLPD